MRKIQLIITILAFSLPTAALAQSGQGSGGTWSGYGKHARRGHRSGGEFKEKAQAHRQQQRQENQSFRESIKDLSPQEKATSIAQHREEQYQENTAFHSSLHAERQAKVQARLAENTNMSEEQKQQIMSEMEQRYQKGTARHAQNHSENISLINQLAADPNLTDDQLRSELKSRMEQRRREHEQHRQERRAHRKERRQELREQFGRGGTEEPVDE